MKNLDIIGLFLMLLVIVLMFLVALFNVPVANAKTEPTINELIIKLAPRYGQDPELISRITFCESKHVWDARHDGGRGQGITGLHKDTFNAYLPLYEKQEKETLNYDSNYDQIKMMSFMFSIDEPTRRQWTTYRAYKNGGTYTFYSNTLGKTFTSVCK